MSSINVRAHTRGGHAVRGHVRHWMAKAFKNAGKPGHSLHAALHVAKGQKIPAKKMSRALGSKNPHMRAMAQLAKNANG